MKKCPFCSNDIEEDSILCIYCGNEVKKNESSSSLHHETKNEHSQRKVTLHANKNSNKNNKDDVAARVGCYFLALILFFLLYVLLNS